MKKRMKRGMRNRRSSRKEERNQVRYHNEFSVARLEA